MMRSIRSKIDERVDQKWDYKDSPLLVISFEWKIESKLESLEYKCTLNALENALRNACDRLLSVFDRVFT